MPTPATLSLEPTAGNLAIRPARREDSRRIGELYRIAADGVADYIWSQMAAPGEDLLDVAERRYAREAAEFSYRNTLLAERDGVIAGMMLAYPMPARSEPIDEADCDPVLRPYMDLEVPGSLYVAGIAVDGRFRRHGIARDLLALAIARARTEGLNGLSAIVFASNAASRSLFEAHGFDVVNRCTVVPHPLIRRSGEALLYHARP